MDRISPVNRQCTTRGIWVVASVYKARIHFGTIGNNSVPLLKGANFPFNVRYKLAPHCKFSIPGVARIKLKVHKSTGTNLRQNMVRNSAVCMVFPGVQDWHFYLWNFSSQIGLPSTVRNLTCYSWKFYHALNIGL